LEENEEDDATGEKRVEAKPKQVEETTPATHSPESITEAETTEVTAAVKNVPAVIEPPADSSETTEIAPGEPPVVGAASEEGKVDTADGGVVEAPKEEIAIVKEDSPVEKEESSTE